jgi:hypothetical protein
MGIDLAQDPESAELAEDVVPENVIDAMEAHQQQVADKELLSRES